MANLLAVVEAHFLGSAQNVSQLRWTELGPDAVKLRQEGHRLQSIDLLKNEQTKLLWTKMQTKA